MCWDLFLSGQLHVSVTEDDYMDFLSACEEQGLAWVISYDRVRKATNFKPLYLSHKDGCVIAFEGGSLRYGTVYSSMTGGKEVISCPDFLCETESAELHLAPGDLLEVIMKEG